MPLYEIKFKRKYIIWTEEKCIISNMKKTYPARIYNLSSLSVDVS
jgi:hypothetical protein